MAVERSRAMFESYNPDVWVRVRFYESSGGYLVVHRKRRPGDMAHSNAREVYEKEFGMCLVFAEAGHRIEMLEEDPNKCSHDVNIDGIPAELKRTGSANNIVKYAKKSIRKQGAKVVLFQFEENTRSVQLELMKLRSLGYKILYFFSGERKVYRI